MFTEKDIQQISNRGSQLPEVEHQIENFKKGFPFMNVLRPATVNDGIIQLGENHIEKYIGIFEHEVNRGIAIEKFVPASGAASRMFQKLFAFQDAVKSQEQAISLLNEDMHSDVKSFFDNLPKFAFYHQLPEELKEADADGHLPYREILEFLLTEKGLNYGFLPKGLLQFHQYEKVSRTPVEEHMVEGALYGKDSGNKVSLHFTVSPEHLSFFEEKTDEAAKKFEHQYGVHYEIGFSEQKPSTDTIAVSPENEPFRQADGTLLFRPGGHGALLENLNDIDSDIIFVKNIDNVVPDRLKDSTVRYKKALAGVLMYYRQKVFNYLRELEKASVAVPDKLIAEISDFLTKELCVEPAESQYYTEKEDLIPYLRNKLNRPIRVCGMVKNEGEPGGGPFWARNADNTISLQIVEGSQIDKENEEQTNIVGQSTHFNPVDLVCGVRNSKGEKFDLLKYRDPNTGFISHKSKEGKPLKAQELPGLWNGAMADWITLFVEVPVITFNPVKTVNDLLREEHQNS
ncbi:hypothetical protein PbJCM13498_05610 [Prolixibacter bellariivorans]|uniref:DUF4301 domain-containing protein n=1 Tax=Prolixibacter bellariivorans TaxID=314319 RepID=A0A5M4AVN7_9BACT|nr:DUF4301 family protein [Prolixibacter bellariivorans]GET31698.1 hypothetical protein PbJCM13498_05610 [Prolixibacter bellariivorans]